MITSRQKMVRQTIYQDYYNSTEEHDMKWIHIAKPVSVPHLFQNMV